MTTEPVEQNSAEALILARAVGLNALSRAHPGGDLNIPESQSAELWQCLKDIQTEIGERSEEIRATDWRTRVLEFHRPLWDRADLETLAWYRQMAVDFLDGFNPYDDLDEMLQYVLQKLVAVADERLSRELH